MDAKQKFKTEKLAKKRNHLFDEQSESEVGKSQYMKDLSSA